MGMGQSAAWVRPQGWGVDWGPRVREGARVRLRAGIGASGRAKARLAALAARPGRGRSSEIGGAAAW